MASKRSNGEGSIYQQHATACPRRGACKCPWRGALVTGWHDGKPIRKRVSATSRAGAAAKLRKLQEEVSRGQLPHGRIPTVEEWMLYWLDRIVAERNRPGTVRTYRTHVERYIVPLLGRHRLDKLSPEHIAGAWADLRDRGLSVNTIHHAHTILSRALKVAQQRGKVVANAATLMDAPPRATTRPEILNNDQAKAVIRAARDGRNPARWTVALSLGLRQGEALGLRWSDIDLDAGTLTVRHSLGRVKGKGLILGPTKSGSERTIALPGPLLAELKAHRKAQNAERLAAGTFWRDGDYVFAREDGAPYDAKADWQRWKQLLTAADAPDVKGHSARHTAATMLLALGVPLEVTAEILGHSDLKITRGYQHRVDDLHLDAAARMATAYWD